MNNKLKMGGFKMITEYINYLVNVRGLSALTATAYEKDLRAFAHWMSCSSSTARWSLITRDDIDSYVESMKTAGKKPATTNRALAAISGLYGYFKRQGLRVDNPCKYESRRKIGRAIPNIIPTNQLKMAYEHSAGMAKTILGLLITTGIRIQELLDINWEDIDFERSAIHIHGKGMKQREVYTTADVLADLRIYQGMQKPSGQIFFIDQRECRRLVFESLRRYCTAAQLSPHAIRHTMATNMAMAGANVTTIANILGHEHINTTQKYIDARNIEVARVMRSNNILN